MDKNEHGNSTPVPGPHGFGGGAVHQAKTTGTRKTANVDYEDTGKRHEDVYKEEISDEDLGNWVFETWGDVQACIEELAILANKMYNFSSSTKNVHREMKNWCVELKQKTKRAIDRSKVYHPYLDRASDRIVDLSSSLREMSVLQLQPNTSDKATETEPESLTTDPNSGHPTARRNTISVKSAPRNRTPETLPAREGKRIKSKMKDERARTRQGKNKTKNETIVVRSTGTTTYADMARKLKKSINIDAINVSVKGMKRSRKGDLILQLDKGPAQEEAAGRLRDAVTKALGTEAVVEHSPNTTLIEIRDLDPTTTEEEVMRAVANTTGTAPGTPRVLRMVSSYGGNLMAIVKVRSRDAVTLQTTGRLLVGLVRCRVRLKAQKTRCYRCHGFGHTRKECNGKDRTAQCMTCGQLEHKAKDCRSNPSCVLCKDSGHEYDHYPGSSTCYEARQGQKQL